MAAQDTPPEMSDADLRVISNLYDSVANDAPYEPFLFAMDDVLNKIDAEQDQESWISATRSAILGHFAKATHVFDLLSRRRLETPLTFVERSPMASCIMDRSGRVIAANRRFETRLGDTQASLLERFATPEDARKFRGLCTANDPSTRIIVHIILSDDSTVPVLIGRASEVALQGADQVAFYANLIQPVWRQETGDLLASTFGLGSAETDILRQFVETGSVQRIADLRGRSIRTVRTQLSNIFAKMGLKGQTDLAFFLTTLGELSEDRTGDAHRNAAGDTRDSDIRVHLVTRAGTVTEVLDYGPEEGAPVLLIQSSHPPELTRPLRRSLSAAGLRVIAPLKPGSGRSDKIAGRPGPEQMAQIYAHLLEAMSIERAVIAGQASGGLYALEFARQFAEKCQGVFLIDTGVPFKNRSEIMTLPAGLRRTMLPARFLPDLLYLPHKIVAANFGRSREGEANVVNYFFADSPEEQELTRTKSEFYTVTRELIRYSFDDTDRLVEDVVRWAAPWEPLLLEVGAALPVHFFQGAGNRFFSVERIEAWIAGRANYALTVAPSAGQLAAFAHADLLAEALAALHAP